MEESGLDKKVARVEKMLSLEQVQRILQSPEVFTAWVARASFEDFSFFLSGINYALYTHIGTPEYALEDINRGLKENLNIVVRKELGSDTEKQYMVATFVPPHGKELQLFLRNTFKKFQDLVRVHAFDDARTLLSWAIVLLQPFPDGNKRTARAISILMQRVFSGDALDIAMLTRDYFFSKEKTGADVLKSSDDAFSAQARAMHDALEAYMSGHGITQIYDSREDGETFEAWDYWSTFLPDASSDIERYMHLTPTESDELMSELRALVSLYNEDLPTQIAPVLLFDTLEAFPDYSLRAHVEMFHDGIHPTIQVALFVRILLKTLDEPMSVRMLNHFITTFRQIRDGALARTLGVDAQG